MHPSLAGEMTVVSEKSSSAFASSYAFWDMVGATMWDIVIGCVALVSFLAVIGVTLLILFGAGAIACEGVKAAKESWDEWRWSR